MKVVINPAPQHIIDHYEKFRSFNFQHAPASVFPGALDAPTAAEIELARELWRALDVVSRKWYCAKGVYRGFQHVQLTDSDIAALSAE